MKHVTLTTLVFIYLFLYLNSVLFLWLWNVWQKSRREKHAVRHRVRCNICTHEFEDPSDAELPRCPRCGSLNERLGYQTL